MTDSRLRGGGLGSLCNYSIPNIVLAAALPKHGSINVCHINIRNLFGKMNGLNDSLRGTSIHVIMMSETWLKPDISDGMIHIPGSKLFRHDRIAT